MNRRWILAAPLALALAACSAAEVSGDLKVGMKAPDFTLPREAGGKLKLSDYQGKKNVVLLFSRAHW